MATATIRLFNKRLNDVNTTFLSGKANARLQLRSLNASCVSTAGGGGLRPAGRALRRAGRGGRRRIPDGVLQELPAGTRPGSE